MYTKWEGTITKNHLDLMESLFYLTLFGIWPMYLCVIDWLVCVCM